MKKMYNTTPLKSGKMVIHLEAPKTRIQMTTCKSGVYSYYTKAQKRANKKLQYSLKRLDIDNI